MKKLSWLGVLSLCALLGAVVVVSGFGAPDPPAAVVDDFWCGLTGDPIEAPPMFTEESHAVHTPSGMVQFKCTFDIPAGFAPKRTVRVEGLGCSAYFGYTDDGTAVYTPGGKAHLWCNINPGHPGTVY